MTDGLRQGVTPTAHTSAAPDTAGSDLVTDVLVVGAGPAGSAAAAWAVRGGRDTVLADAAVFPRDKTCGDGLTPRAVAELDLLGLGEWLRSRAVNRGLRLTGFGQSGPWAKQAGHDINYVALSGEQSIDGVIIRALFDDSEGLILPATPVA